MPQRFFAARGRGTLGQGGSFIEAWFPQPVEVDAETAQSEGTGTWVTGRLDRLDRPGPSPRRIDDAGRDLRERTGAGLPEGFECSLLCLIDTAAAPASVEDAYLRLHLLSLRLARPHEVCLDGMFTLMPMLCWTSAGPVEPNRLEALRSQVRSRGEWLRVWSVDRFPPMTDYVVPPGVRIADTARVRLGAHLGEGTTVMHEGFINFNAGTLGTAMIEGRISAGVVVGEDSDLGGGASTMGTLSGGNDVVISVGRRCLLGANSGLGIPLGDGCTVEAGLYLTAAAKVEVLDDSGALLRTVKAAELAGADNLLYIRNSLTGAIQARPNRRVIDLNPEIHINE
ncbi:MAG: 2,3,4,5-tetrahydropyridine-2,6-dicarboxylate N-succinyltransferase [Gammaproteobacteria bacterium AqS3]|nr:2,3,4,5-tetrahydropyridine-2,6-dicarboxylate N-succinyltransferase [Gammaproteobacteria bacterium AqS3]